MMGAYVTPQTEKRTPCENLEWDDPGAAAVRTALLRGGALTPRRSGRLGDAVPTAGLGMRIKAARQARGWPLHELARRAGVSVNVAQSAEWRPYRVGAGGLTLVMQALGLDSESESDGRHG